MSNSGAKAALKGYRLQTLYTLVEILDSNDSDNVFQPEGEEDLAIYRSNELIRVIQVKARNENLTLSSFNPDKKDSFFHRVSDQLCIHHNLSIEVVSFGEIGSEINKAWGGDANSQSSVRTKLKKHGINEGLTDLLFEKIKWIIVSEQELEARLRDHLAKTITAGDPNSGFSLLLAWLYYAAEHKEKITKQDLLNKINAVGKYLSERAAHHQEWYKSIKPLTEKDQTEQKEVLAKQFYKGVSSRFSHIQAGLDIARTEHIDNIWEAFHKGHKTVIVHGASGQGKTTLAYRYLHDFIPDEWCFQINFIESRKHAETIALAIADHLSVFNAHLYIYIDVSPRDLEWTALIKSLLDQHNIKILVTIREEDLARQNVSNVELGFPKGIPLNFSKSEAKIIYQNLIDKKVAKPYPSFSDAWSRFGGKGALLEYIFFLTQTESLKDKLAFQVKRIQEEVRQKKLEPAALQLLFSCAVATAYESRIQITGLVSSINLLDPASTFDLFEKEYLLRYSADQLYIESLHPLRSKLLVEVLSDPAFNPWVKAAITVLPCILESDLENFLLYAFTEHPQEYTKIYQELSKLTFHSWQGYAGISRALIWYGIYSYISANQGVIDKARKIAGNHAWCLLLDPDIANVMEEDVGMSTLEIMGKNSPDQLAQVQLLKNKMVSTDIIYQDLIVWLSNKSFPTVTPENGVHCLGMSEILFWLGWLNIHSQYNSAWLLNDGVIEKIADITCLSELTLALYYYDHQVYKKFMLKNKSEIESLFQQQTNTLWLEYKTENPVAHYIVPMDLSDETKSLNEQTGYRAKILRKIFPDMEKFGGKGYGHQVTFIELPFDESEKLSILKKSLPIEQLVNINVAYTNLANYIYRPDDWTIYAENIISTRKQIVAGLTCLNKALIAYFKKNKSRSVMGWKIESNYWEELSRVNQGSFMYPKVAVDPWGFTSEGTKNNQKEAQSNLPTPINASLMLAQYKDFKKSWGGYLNSITNFFMQSDAVLMVNGFIGRLPEAQHAALIQQAEELGLSYSKYSVHLTVVNFNDAKNELEKFQFEFRDRFKDIIDISALKKLEIQELSKFEKAWSLWYQFAFHPDQYWKDAPEVRAMAITRKASADLLASIKKALTENPTPEWQANILSDSYCDQGQSGLWLGLNIQSLSSIDTAYLELVNILTDAIRPVEYSELKYYTLTNRWSKLVIIPMMNGATLNHISWEILSASFAGNQPILSEEKPWLTFLPRPLSEKAINHFQFEKIKNKNAEDTEDLSKELSELFALVMHFSNFIEIVPNLNEVGEKVLAEYLVEFYEKLSKNISAADAIILTLRGEIKNIDTAWLEVLKLCENAIYLYGKPESNQLDIHLGDCKEWALLLQEALSSLNLYGIDK